MSYPANDIDADRRDPESELSILVKRARYQIDVFHAERQGSFYIRDVDGYVWKD